MNPIIGIALALFVSKVIKQNAGRVPYQGAPGTVIGQTRINDSEVWNGEAWYYNSKEKAQ